MTHSCCSRERPLPRAWTTAVYLMPAAAVLRRHSLIPQRRYHIKPCTPNTHACFTSFIAPQQKTARPALSSYAHVRSNYVVFVCQSDDTPSPCRAFDLIGRDAREPGDNNLPPNNGDNNGVKRNEKNLPPSYFSSSGGT